MTKDQLMSINFQSEMYVFQTEEIQFIKAEGRCTKFIFRNKADLLITKPLGEVEKLLPEGYFLKCHRGIVVNINQIKMFDKATAEVVLHDDSRLKIAARRVREVYRFFRKN